MLNKAKYICIEGCDGVGKSTQVEKLSTYLLSKGFKVLTTKEPGSPHAPVTMELRNVMLNAKYDEELTKTAREFISQAIRSIHLEKVIAPALEQYDFIVQDRGTLSGIAYGEACGNDIKWLNSTLDKICKESVSRSYDGVYDAVIYLTGNVAADLSKAQAAKQEFEAGDAIEKKGVSFMELVNNNMKWHSKHFKTKTIEVDGKSIDEVFDNILKALELV